MLNDPAVLILNISPSVKAYDPERMQQRQLFYNVTTPANITFDEIEKCYRFLAAQNGWSVEKIFFERRWTFSTRQDKVYYAAMVLKRKVEIPTTNTVAISSPNSNG